MYLDTTPQRCWLRQEPGYDDGVMTFFLCLDKMLDVFVFFRFDKMLIVARVTRPFFFESIAPPASPRLSMCGLLVLLLLWVSLMSGCWARYRTIHIDFFCLCCFVAAKMIDTRIVSFFVLERFVSRKGILLYIFFKQYIVFIFKLWNVDGCTRVVRWWHIQHIRTYFFVLE